MRKTFVAGLVVVAGLLAAASVGAQSTADFVPAPAQGQQFELSIRNIMRAEENVGVAPSQIRWTDDSQWVYFRWRPGGLAWDAETSSYRVRADGSGLEKLTDEEVEDAAVSVANGDLSADRRWRVSSVSGDLWLVDRQTMDARRLTETQDNEGQPLFSADGEAIFFRRDNNLFRFELETGELEQVTFVSDNPEPRDEPEAEGQKAFLEQQQLELFEHVRREAERRERAEERREEAAADRPATVYLNRGERLQGLTPTRDGAYVVLQAFTSAQGDTNTVVPDWVTANGYTRDINGRAKVGDVQSTSRAGILTAATGEVNWIEAAPDDYDGEGTPRVYNAGWNDAGTTAYVFAVSFD
ncbi:MAG: DPP IV N-terminal domain-containing protein, partial [Acidobacteriota bacterium]